MHAVGGKATKVGSFNLKECRQETITFKTKALQNRIDGYWSQNSHFLETHLNKYNYPLR